jgi:hypothetical protein
MSQPPLTVFQNVSNLFSKGRHTPQDGPSLYSSALLLLKDNYGTEDLGIVITKVLKSEDFESVSNFLLQLEYSDMGVFALVESPSLSLAFEAVINSKNAKMLNTILDIILKWCALTESLPMTVDRLGAVFERVMQLIPHDDLTVSERACKLTETIICTSSSPRNFLDIMHSESLKYITADKNLYLRFANIWARILGKNDLLFNACNSVGAAAGIVSLCRSSQDILVQIVSIELLTEFSKTSSGLQVRVWVRVRVYPILSLTLLKALSLITPFLSLTLSSKEFICPRNYRVASQSLHQ